MISLKDFLLKPENYPEKPSRIEYFETHISQVFVGDKYVYKIKKPVDFGFLNFTTLKRRQYYVNREVELNRRLAKDLYIGVKKIYFDGKDFSFTREKGFKVYEYAVYMKRINEEKILYNLISRGELVLDRIKDLALLLYNFHKTAPLYRGKEYGSLKSVTFNTEENFHQVEPFIGKTIDQESFHIIADYTRRFLKEKRELFHQRGEKGFVREVHGDLHSQHICLEDDIVIFDCIEFNNRFRISDILEDIGFLLMDLDFKGRYDLSSELEKSYFQLYREAYEEALLSFYKIYRAYVRGKIEGFISENIEDKEVKSRVIKKAKDYFSLARFYIERREKDFNPVIFMGVSGSGKSTIASHFKDRYEILRTDEIRKEITGIDRERHHYVGYGESIYSKDISEKTYKELIKRGIQRAREGEKVILDGTFLNPEYREYALKELCSKGFNPIFINFFADERILRERISKRIRENNDISDAHLEILERQIKNQKPIDDIPSYRLMNINSQADINDIVKGLKRVI